MSKVDGVERFEQFISSLNDDNNDDDDETKRKESGRNRGLFALAVAATVIGALSFGFGPFLSPALRRHAAPYIPANESLVSKLVKAADHLKPSRTIDLGSGDGVIALSLAENGHRCDGVEMNRWLQIASKFRAHRRGASDSAKFYCSDLWRFNVSKYDAVVFVGVQSMMAPLERKLADELDDDAVVLCGRFPLETWRHDPELLPPSIAGAAGVDSLWAYRVKENRS
jgi:hypothetical protein